MSVYDDCPTNICLKADFKMADILMRPFPESNITLITRTTFTENILKIDQNSAF